MPDPEIAEVVKRLPGYLQPVVTLMAIMVPPSEESKMREKMGREALAQATSMVLMVSILVHLDLHQVTTDRLSNNLFLFPFQSVIAMTWAHKDCDRSLKVTEKWTE